MHPNEIFKLHKYRHRISEINGQIENLLFKQSEINNEIQHLLKVIDKYERNIEEIEHKLKQKQ